MTTDDLDLIRAEGDGMIERERHHPENTDPPPLSYAPLDNIRRADGAIAEWAIGDYLPRGGCATGEFTLVLYPEGVRIIAFADGRGALARFLALPVMAELDVPNVGAAYVDQALAEHLA